MNTRRKHKSADDILDEYGAQHDSPYDDYRQIEVETAFADNPRRVWTIVEGDRGMYLINGLHQVNAVGYWVTTAPANDADAEGEFKF